MSTDRSVVDKLPRAFGRLWLLRMLARGGMGEVFLASTTGIEGAERPCVVKTIRREHVKDRSFLARFLDEARVQAQLQHPGVAQILEASHDAEGEPYVVVEYVEGRSLSEVRRRAISLGVRIAWPEAVAVAIAIAEALGHVHERKDADGKPLGIVHRDLSPQNVMVGYGGEVKLIDFGTARGENRRSHTIAGVVFAKPGYIAPEVANGITGDYRVDLYALGVMLWELLAGRRFLQGDPQDHLAAVAKGEKLPPPIAKLVSAPSELDEIIATLCAQGPGDRFESGRIVASELAKVLGQAESLSNGERGVRARIAHLMYGVYPSEPARSRAEFQTLVERARTMRIDAKTPADKLSAIELSPKPAGDDPQRLGGTAYRLLRKLGAGAMGVVYEAEHVELGRRVALKILAPEHASSSSYTQRFRREARAMSRLSHPGLLTLHDFGQASDGRLYCAMELLEGETLERKLAREGRMPWRDAFHLGKKACDALSVAHAASIVHRDLKPANIFLTSAGELKVLDFGVAKARLGDSEPMEPVGAGLALYGTPEYMAPEQARGPDVDARADIYALGCVLYELITGAKPFVGASAVAVLDAKKQLPVAPSARLKSAEPLPKAIDALILRALSPRPEERFASAAEFRRALGGTREERKRASSRLLGWLGIAAATSLAVGLAFVHDENSGEKTQRGSSSEPAPVAALASPQPKGDEGAKLRPSARPATKAKAVRAKSPKAAKPPKEAEGPEREARGPARAAAPPAPAPEQESALSLARRVAEKKPSEPGAQRAWAEEAASAAEWKEALRAAQAWALLEAGTEPRIFMARMLARTGQHAEASSVLVDLLEDYPESDAARALLRDYGGIEAAILSGRVRENLVADSHSR